MSLQVIVKEKNSGVIIVSPIGSINTATAPILELEVDRVIGKSPRIVIFDMEAVDYISSMGVRVVIKTKKNLAKSSGRFVMVNLPPQIKRVFDIISALPKEEIFESIQEMDDYLTTMQRQVLKGE